MARYLHANAFLLEISSTCVPAYGEAYSLVASLKQLDEAPEGVIKIKIINSKLRSVQSMECHLFGLLFQLVDHFNLF